MSLAHFDEIYDICNSAEKDMFLEKKMNLKRVKFKNTIRTSTATLPSLANVSKKEEAKEFSTV